MGHPTRPFMPLTGHGQAKKTPAYKPGEFLIKNYTHYFIEDPSLIVKPEFIAFPAVQILNIIFFYGFYFSV
jgi:hypothetical protein